MYIQVHTKHILVYTGLQMENGIWRDILVYTSIYSDILIQRQYMHGYDVYWSIYNNIQGQALYILMQILYKILWKPSCCRFAGGRSHWVRTRACGGRSWPMPRGRRVFCQARCRRHGRGNWQIFGWARLPGAQWLRGNAPLPGNTPNSFSKGKQMHDTHWSHSRSILAGYGRGTEEKIYTQRTHHVQHIHWYTLFWTQDTVVVVPQYPYFIEEDHHAVPLEDCWFARP